MFVWRCAQTVQRAAQGAVSGSCGYVAGLIIVHTFHPKAPATRFLEWFPKMETEGTDLPVLVNGRKGNGVGVTRSSRLSFAAISRHINEGHPLITRVTKRKYLHWVVTYGVGSAPDRVFIAGNGIPWISKNVTLWQDFWKVWYNHNA